MTTPTTTSGQGAGSGPRAPEIREKVTVRFAGDSGDGMQLAGDRFATVSAILGDDVVTLADYPAEIRAPTGTVAGVSGFQLNVGATDVYTAGDQVDLLVAMNPAALKANLALVRKGGILLLNSDSFSDKKSLEKAGYDRNPLETGELQAYRIYPVQLTRLAKETLKGTTLSSKEVDRCKNFCALGLTCWVLSRPIEPTLKWIAKKFAKLPEIAEANQKVLRAGYDYGETAEIYMQPLEIRREQQKRDKGTYRYVAGNVAAALGLVAAGMKSGRRLYLGSYPITPATEILQELSRYKNYNVTTFQAEDEIAAIGAAIGASFAGALAATSTSGPGLALKGEFVNLAVMTELPLVIIDVQRAGPSTGLPTKTEQTDLLQAMYGRNGESPVVVLAARSPSDCFAVCYEACRIALKYMTPVMVLTDGYLANGSEAWRIPEPDELAPMETQTPKMAPADFKPYLRDPVTLARPWAIPGTPGFEHRIGGLEKEDGSGKVSYDSKNHEKMIHLRAKKIEGVAREIPACHVYGDKTARLLVLGWGSTYGSIKQAVTNLVKKGVPVAGLHLRYINPLPADLGDILRRYDRVLLPENNLGQLAMLVRSKYVLPIESYAKVEGQPFQVADIEDRILKMLEA